MLAPALGLALMQIKNGNGLLIKNILLIKRSNPQNSLEIEKLLPPNIKKRSCCRETEHRRIADVQLAYGLVVSTVSGSAKKASEMHGR